MNNFHNVDHPIWKLAHLIIVLLTLTFVLWMNADHFDDTEIKTVMTMFIALAGYQGVTEIFRKKAA